MIYLSNNFKELEFDDNMMYSTATILSFITKPFNINGEILGDAIEKTLNKKLYSKFIKPYKIRNGFDKFNIFTTSFIDDKNLKSMFSNVAIHEGSDGEEEFVSALEINNRVVLILHSPDRGSQIRIEDNNLPIIFIFDEVVEIIKVLCDIYNKRLTK